MKKHLLLTMIAILMLVLCSCECRHQTVVDPAVAATCLETGLTEGSHCEKCSEVLTAQEVVPALGHTYELDPQVDPVCLEVGATPGFHCATCGEVFVAQEEIAALGHTEQVDAAVDATCVETGLTEGKHCSVCEEILVAQETIPAKGHVPYRVTAEEFPHSEFTATEGVTCTVCGELFPFLTDEASENPEIKELEDGGRIVIEKDALWGLERETLYTQEGKLLCSTICEKDGGAGFLTATFNADGTIYAYDELLYEDAPSYTGMASYNASGELLGFSRYSYNADGGVERIVEYLADGAEHRTNYYDYNENGENVRVRTYYPDGSKEFLVLQDVDPGVAFEKAASDVWEVTPAEIGLLADDGENPVSLGIVPRNAAAASVSIVDYLTGETVETLEISLGETVAFQPLPAGYYYIQAACQDYTDYKGGVWLVSGAQEGSAAFPVNLENPEAVFEEPVEVRVLNEDGKAESRCAIAIAVTRNNTRHISSMELETDRAGYVCFISTSEAEDSTSDIYRVAQFSLREGCILGYYNEEAEFVPVVMDGSSECVIRLG